MVRRPEELRNGVVVVLLLRVARRRRHLGLDLLARFLAQLLDLLFLVLLVREEHVNLLSLLAHLRGLRAGFEQVQRLAVLLWKMEANGERRNGTRYLQERYGIDSSWSAQNCDISMDSFFMSSPAAVMRCSLAWFMTSAR